MKLLKTFAVLTCGILTLLGCGGGVSDAPEIVPVTGTVNFDGVPIPTASVIFVDASGKDKSYYAEVIDGAFKTEMTAGTKKVTISANREIPGKTVPDGGGTGTVPATEQYIPQKYNEATTLEENIFSTGPNELTFDLKSK